MPLSKNVRFTNGYLYYSIPSEDLLTALRRIHFKENGNVVAIIVQRKTTSKEYISTNHPEVKHCFLMIKAL